MKIRFTNKSKQIFTVAEMPIVKRIMDAEKENGMDAEECAYIAMKLISEKLNEKLVAEGYARVYMNDWKIVSPTAEMSKNCHVMNYYSSDSEHCDIWLNWIAVSEYYGAVECGAYLSDIYSITCGESKDNDVIYSNMYINQYKPLKLG